MALVFNLHLHKACSGYVECFVSKDDSFCISGSTSGIHQCCGVSDSDSKLWKRLFLQGFSAGCHNCRPENCSFGTRCFSYREVVDSFHQLSLRVLREELRGRTADDCCPEICNMPFVEFEGQDEPAIGEFYRFFNLVFGGEGVD